MPLPLEEIRGVNSFPHNLGHLFRRDPHPESLRRRRIDVGKSGLRPQRLKSDDADFAFPPLKIQCLSEPRDEEFGRGIRRDVRLAIERRSGIHVDQVCVTGTDVRPALHR